MKELIFFVQGSANEPYKVTFRKNDNNLSVYCTCPAGDNGQYCKHRFNILGGITDDIVSGNQHEADLVTSWLAGSDVEAALSDVMKAEEQFEIAKNELTSAKKRLAKAFRD
jgi:hypothetical protein